MMKVLVRLSFLEQLEVKKIYKSLSSDHAERKTYHTIVNKNKAIMEFLKEAVLVEF